ncbi:TIGR02186 family protein [Devosia sp. A449]
MIRLVLCLCLLLISPSTVRAERLLTGLSHDTVEITSSFSGERITLFGNIVPGVGEQPGVAEGPFQVVIVVVGPTQDRVTRKMTRQFGIWLNTAEVVFHDFPSFLRVMSSDRLRSVADLTSLSENFILPEAYTLAPNQAGAIQTLAFGRELVRLMAAESLLGIEENGVNFLSDTVYSAQLRLPAGVPPGRYVAQTFVFKDGKIVARKASGFSVRKMGFERFVSQSSTQFPLLYGLVCVVLALFTGWLGGVIFKR